MPEAGARKVKLLLLLTAPDGVTTLSAESASIDSFTDSAPSGNLTGLTCGLRSNHIRLCLTVTNPQLWWPNGYGDQALYQAKVLLVPETEDAGEPLDSWQKKIGLRTMTVNTDAMADEVFDSHMINQEDDLDDGNNMILAHGEKRIIVTDRKEKKIPGRNFAYEVNGLQIFAMGADYIPEDNILTRQNRRRTDMLLASAQESHYNCLRVWGGGYFLDDFFYDVCDERGLIVWQDFMFGCTVYPADPVFLKRVSEEVDYNIKRLRNHACLAMWCGNNEILEGLKYWGWQSRYTPEVYEEFYRNYDKLFRELLPSKVKEWDEGRSYVHTSPYFSNWGRPDSWNIGDSHNWGIWYGKKTFESSDTEIGRFQSEFGFESFPEMKTIATFASPEDYEIESEVIDCPSAQEFCWAMT